MTDDDEILEFFMEAARIQALIHTGDPKYESAPLVRGPHNSGEPLPNGDTAAGGADTSVDYGPKTLELV